MATSPEPPSSRTQMLLAAAVGAVLLVSGIVALARNGDDRAVQPVTSTPDAMSTDTVAPGASAPVPTTAPQGTEPVNQVALPGVNTVGSDDTAVTSATGSQPGVAPVPRLTAGIEADWAESTIAVAPPLDTVAPTEVVTLSSNGLLRRIEVPSGRVRTIDVSDIDAGGSNLVIDDRTIVVFAPDAIYRITDGQPVTRTDLPEGVVFVQSRPGTGQFVVTSPTISDGEAGQEWILEPDGSIEPVAEGEFVDGLFWARTFSPTGDVLLNRPGGAYAVGADSSTRRLSTGDLVATGVRHYAVEECDEQLQCSYSVVDWFTSEAIRGVLDERTEFGFLDPSTRISPDGRSIVYRDDSAETGIRRIVDVATGQGFDLGPPTTFFYPDAWAADGSGLFVDDGFAVQFVAVATGESTALGGFDVNTLATRPALVNTP